MNQHAPLALLVLVGTLQMTGDLLGSPALKAIGAATGASPAPKVFTKQNGLETFTAHFWLDWTGQNGQRISTEITPRNYAGLSGPYNRRNPYGAALAGGPWLSESPLTAPMLNSVQHYALCGKAPLLREMGLLPLSGAEAPVLRIELRVPPDDPHKQWQLSFSGNCNG